MSRVRLFVGLGIVLFAIVIWNGKHPLPQPVAVQPRPKLPSPAKYPPKPKQTPVEAARARLQLLNRPEALAGRGTPLEQVEQLLEQPVILQVEQATIGEVVEMMRAALPVNVLLDTKALEEAAFWEQNLFTASTPKPLKLSQALELLLIEANLDFVCKNDSLVVTTDTGVEFHPITKIYEVGDLIRPTGVEHEHETVDFDSLIQLIESNVTPTGFRDHSGPSRIQLFEPNDLLIIEQNRRGHEQIVKFFTELRRGRGLSIPETLKIAGPAVNLAQQQEPPPRAGAVKDPAADPEAKFLRFEFTDEGLGAELVKKMKPAERLEYQLRRRVLLQMQNATISELVKLLGDKLQVNVMLDRRALEEAAFDPATMLQYLPNAGTRLSSSLRQLLFDYSLSYVVEEETLLITTRTAQENKQFLRYYSVGELIRPIGISSHLIQSDFDSLIQLITSSVQPTTWKSNGGQGDLSPQEALDLLLVSNTCEVLEQLDDLIAQLRKIHAAKAETVQANDATLQRVVYQLVLPREAITKEILDKQGLVSERQILQGELQYSMEDLLEMIKKTIEPGSWADDKHRIDALGPSLIVTHSQATHRKLHDLLHELGITQSQHNPLQQHGYGGGGFGGGAGGGGGGLRGGTSQSTGGAGGGIVPPVGNNRPANPNPTPSNGGIF
jgi:hypothetical protein